jgi:ubiquitin C-terminal hydrolase
MYIKPDILEGDNKYHCEQYDKKISAQRRSYLKNLSSVVVINLKRFEYDLNTMQRLKVNDYCEFPESINFKKWSKEGITEEENKYGNALEEDVDDNKKEEEEK